MKLLDIIRPHFGAISICGAFLHDERKEFALDHYDKDGTTKMDANFHLYADLDLKDPGFEQGLVRFEFYGSDETISSIQLDVAFKDSDSFEEANLDALYEYLTQSDLFDNHTEESSVWTFRNGINELHVEIFDSGFTLELYPPSATGIEPKENYERGVLRTVSGLSRNEEDEWDVFRKNAKNPIHKLLGRYSQLSDEEKARVSFKLQSISNRLFGKDGCYYFFRFFADMVKECGDEVRPFVKNLYISHLATASESIRDEMDDLHTIVSYNENTRFDSFVYEKMLNVTYYSYGRIYPPLSIAVSERKYKVQKEIYDKFSEVFVEGFISKNGLVEELEEQTGINCTDLSYRIYSEMVNSSGVEGPIIEPWEPEDYEDAIYTANLPKDEAREEEESRKEDLVENLMRILNQDRTFHED